MRHIYFSIFALLFLFSCESEQENYVNGANQPPSAFEVNHIIPQENIATLSWTKAIDPDGDKVSYSIYKGETSVAEELTATFYTFTNLKSGTKYSGKIVASDDKGAISEISYEFTTKGVADTSSSGSGGNSADTSGNTYDTSGFKIPDELKSYYKDIDFSLRGDKLRDELAALLIGTHRFLEYEERHNYLYKPTDPKNSNNVILIYTGESVSKNLKNSYFDTEHVYPQSSLPGGKTGKARGDLHNLYPCKKKVNNSRGNVSFTEGSGGYAKKGNAWYPGDDWRGDVARVVFYVNLRYDDSIDNVCKGGVKLLLEWNAKDPVSEVEKKRNEFFQQAQGNRNPFIDNPYLANLIWGGEGAENLWK